MNNFKIEKYCISPNIIEEKSLSSQRFRTLFNFKRVEQSKNVSVRLDKCDSIKYAAKKKDFLCNSLEIGEKILVLADRIKKNQHLEKFISKQFRTYRISTKKQCLQ